MENFDFTLKHLNDAQAYYIRQMSLINECIAVPTRATDIDKFCVTIIQRIHQTDLYGEVNIHFGIKDRNEFVIPTTAMSVPITYEQRDLGTLTVQGKAQQSFDQTDAACFSTLAAIIGHGLATIQEVSDTPQQTLSIESNHKSDPTNDTLASIALALASEIQLSDVLKQILVQAKNLVPYQTANIALLEGDSLYIRQWAGYDEATLAVVQNLRQPLIEYPLDLKVISTKRAYLVNNTDEEPLWTKIPAFAWIKSYVNIPLCSHDRVLGSLRIDGQYEHQFSEEMIQRLLPLANAASVAIERAALLEEAKHELADRKYAELELLRLNQELEQKVEQRTQELRHTKETVEAILNSSSDAIILAFAETGIERVNDTFDMLFSDQTAPSDAYLKRPLEQLATYPDDASLLKQTVEAVIHDGQVRHLELSVTSWNGNVFDAEIGIAPFMESRPGVICTLSDISERKRAEIELRESEAELRTLFASMEDLIAVIDDEGRYLKFAPTNPVWLPRSLNEVVGKTLHELFPRKDADLFLGAVKRALNTHTAVDIEYVLPTQGGEVWQHTQFTPLSKYTVFSITRDITTRRRIEDALVASEIKFRSLVQAAPVCICLLDMDGFILETNQATNDISGYSEAELLGHPLVKFIAPDHRASFEAQRATLPEKHLLRMELDMVRKDGVLFVMDCSAALLINEMGQPTSTIIIQRDITEQKKFEKTLIYHASLLDKLSDAVIATDLDFRILTWNAAAQQIYGWSPEEVIGQPTSILRPKDQTMLTTDTLKKEFEEKGMWTGEVTQQRKDGRLVYIQSLVTLVRDTNGVPTSIVAVNRDITEQKQSQMALRDSKARLAEAQRIAHLGNWELDLATNFTTFSEEAANILSLDTLQTDADQTLENICIDDRDVIRDVYHRLLVNHEQRVEVEVCTSSTIGTPKYLWMTAEAIVQNGQATRLFGTILDISERKVIEEALKRSEAELRTIFNSIPHQILMIDKDLIIHTVNDAGRRQLMQIFQKPPREGDNLLEYVAEVSMPLMLDGINHALRGKVITKDVIAPIGDLVNYFEVTFNPVVTAEEITIGVCLLIQNVTERKTSEHALRESEARLTEAQRIARLGNWELEVVADTLETVWSPETWRILGYETVLAQPPSVETQFIRIHPDDAAQVREFLAQALNASTPLETEYRYRKDNGQWGNYWLNCRPVIKDGKVIRLVGTILDVTERKHSEMILRESQERLKIIFENSPDAMCLGNHRKGIVDVNRTFELLTGYARNEIVGKRPRQMKFLSREQISKFYRLSPDKLPPTMDFLLTRRDGTVIYAEASAYQIVIQGETLLLVAIRDVTQRRQAEIELRQAFEKQSELYELKSRFISMTSHEFRTPLATILAASDVLKRYKEKITEEQYYQRLEKIQAQVRHLTLMLDDVSILGRIQTGNLEFRPDSVDVVQLFKDIIDETELANDETQRISFESAFPTLTAYIDQKLVRQTLANLVNNAIKYSPEGSPIEVRLEVKHGNILFSVADNGIGIPEQNQVHLFDPFYRADNVGNISGSGLGLAIAKEAVTLHQGSINFVSNRDQGTIFIVQLPLVHAPASPTEN